MMAAAVPWPLMRVPLSAALLLVLAGCMTLPAPHAPMDVGAPWLDAGQDLLARRVGSCGFCSGTSEAPEFSWVGLDEGGGVLVFRLSAPRTQDGDVEWVHDDDRLRYGRILDQFAAGGAPPSDVRVHEVGAAQMSPKDAEAVLEVVGRAVKELRPSRDTGEVVTDCGPASYAVRTSGGWRTERAGCAVEARGGWAVIVEQLSLLQAWQFRVGAPDR